MVLWKKKREEIPESYRDLTDEQLLDRLQQAEKDAAEKKELETKVQSEQTEHGKTKAALQALEASARKPEVKPEVKPQPKPNGQNQDSNEPISVFDDEAGAFAQRNAPIAAAAIHAGMLAAKAEAMRLVRVQGDTRVWEKYEKEINEIMEKEDPVRKIYPQVWLNALTFVKGIHMKEIMDLQTKGGEAALFSEGISDNGRSPEQRNTPEDDKLSQSELDIAKKMKIKPEDYLKRKKGMTVVAS